MSRRMKIKSTKRKVANVAVSCSRISNLIFLDNLFNLIDGFCQVNFFPRHRQHTTVSSCLTFHVKCLFSDWETESSSNGRSQSLNSDESWRRKSSKIFQQVKDPSHASLNRTTSLIFRLSPTPSNMLIGVCLRVNFRLSANILRVKLALKMWRHEMQTSRHC